jgi:uncharacterized membrane protein
LASSLREKINMDANTVVAIIAGVAAPALASLLKRPEWNARRQFVVAALTSLGLGSAANAVAGPVNADSLAHAALATFAVGQGVYHVLFRHTSVNSRLSALDVASAVVRAVKGAVGK